jgi:hypothetical protein
MKRLLVLALLVFSASVVFAVEPEIVGSLHAVGGYDHGDVAIGVVVNPIEEGRVWLNAKSSYPLLFSERDSLLYLVQIAAREIDIAVANKTTISYQRLVGRFATEGAALVTVSFRTEGYEASYAVVQITSHRGSDILLFNKKDTRDFIDVMGRAHNLVDDYARQVALFR